MRPTATSRPTVRGETNPPTSYPTSVPTIDFGAYSNTTLFNSLANIESDFAVEEDSILFSTFNYKGQEQIGSCDDWTSFAEEELFLPFDNVEFNYLEAFFGVQELGSGDVSLDVANCTDISAIEVVVDALNSGTDAVVVCNNRDWRVYSCDSIGTVFCVDCIVDCSTLSCPGSVLSSINPCRGDCGVAESASYGAVRFAFGEIAQYPQFRAPLLLSSTKDSITVTYNVSKIGTVYCAAFPSYSAVLVSNNALIRQNGVNRVVLDPSVLGTITLSALSPDTSHSIYCYSSDLQDNTMPFSEASVFASAIATECCREISFSTANETELAETALSSFTFAFGLSTPAIEDTTIVLDISAYECSIFSSASQALPILSPNTITFSAGSTAVQGTFRISGSSGCYRIDATDDSADSETRFDGSSLYFSILDTSTPVRAPRLSAAVFSSDGRQISIRFDSASDRGSSVITNFATSFDCSELAVFGGASLSTCLWLSESEVQATLGSGSTVVPGNSLTIVSGVVRAACNEVESDCSVYPYATQSEYLRTIVSGPANPLSPTARFTAATTIGVCDDLRLDPTNSIGQGSRDWAEVAWTVSSSDMAAEDVARIETYLNGNYDKDTDAVAVVPSSELSVGTATIQLQLRNFFNQSSAAQRIVKIVLNTEAPIVSITGSRTWFRWQTIQLSATASLSSCFENATDILSYKWTVYEGTRFINSIVSVSADPTLFKLNPYTVDTTTYFVVLKVTAGDVATTVTKIIEIGESGVIARLVGGNARTVSVLDDLTVDASSSVDVDFPDSELNYVWQCSQISPVFGGSCELYDTVFASPPTTSTVLLSRASSTDEFVSGSVYNVTVTVENSNGLTDSASSVISLVNTSIPVLQIGDMPEFFLLGSRVKINVTLTASDPATVVVAGWEGVGFDLGAVANTPTNVTLDTVGTSIFQLGITPSLLTPGISYTLKFTSSIFDKGDGLSSALALASAAVTILINGPPSGGSMAITPATGEELSTVYTFSTKSWSDVPSDYPLLYYFSYYVLAAESQIFLRSPSQLTFVDAVLSKGLESSNFEVVGVGYCADTLGSEASVSTSTFVVPFGTAATIISASSSRSASTSSTTSELADAISTQLEAEVSSADAAGVALIASAAATSLSIADCSTATDCVSINREACTAVANTCGQCLGGFVGIFGPSNVPCALSSATSPIGAVCNTNTDCITGMCDSFRCVDILKSCWNDCSGNGVCQFFSYGGSQLSSCYENNDNCFSTCSCGDGWHGSDCSINDDDFDSLVALNEEICDSLAATASLQDVTVEVIATRASTISSLLLDTDVISVEALETCGNLIISTITENPGLIGDDDVIDMVVDALSAILSVESKLTPDLITGIVDALNVVLSGRQQILSIDEAASTFITRTLRLSTSKKTFGSADRAIFVVPQTDFESFNNDAPTDMDLNITSAATGEFVGVSLIQYMGNPKGTLANSTSVEVQIFFFDETTTSDVITTIVLQNREAINYNVTEIPVEVEFECIPSFNTYEISVECPDGYQEEVTCPGDLRFGIATAFCPVNFRVPSCQSYDGSGYVADDSCEVVDFTTYETTCRCKNSAPAAPGSAVRRSRRGLASVDENPQLICKEFASAFTISSSELVAGLPDGVSRFEPSNHDFVVHITCGCLLGVMLVVLAVLARRDMLIKVSSDDEGKEEPQFRTFKTLFDGILPLEFSNQESLGSFLTFLRAEHLLSWSTSKTVAGRDTASDRWLVATFKVLHYLFINMLLAVGLYSDDEECQDHYDKASCEGVDRINAITSMCAWNHAKNSCTYSDSNRSYLSIVCIALIIVCVNIIMDQIIRFLVAHAKLAVLRIVNPPAKVSSIKSTVSVDFIDELKAVQTTRSNLMRAASVTLMLEKMDFRTADEEVDAMAAQLANTEYAANEKFAAAFERLLCTSVIDEHNILAIKSRLVKCRANAQDLLHDLGELDSDLKRDEHILKSFLVASMRDRGWGQCVVADSVVFDEDRIAAKRKQRTILQYASLLFLPSYLVACIVVTFYYGAAIGRRAALVWVISLSVALAEDFLLVQPAAIWIRSVSVPSVAKQDFLALFFMLSTRARTLLTRKLHMMDSRNAVVQAFNPVCRASRLWPHLPASRILISLNDEDLPYMHLVDNLASNPLVSSLNYFRQLVLASLLYLPVWLQRIVIELSIIIPSSMVLIAFYFASTVSNGFLAVLVVAVAALLLLGVHRIIRHGYHDTLPHMSGVGDEDIKYPEDPSEGYGVYIVNKRSRPGLTHNFDSVVLYRPEHESMSFSQDNPFKTLSSGASLSMSNSQFSTGFGSNRHSFRASNRVSSINLSGRDALSSPESPQRGIQQIGDEGGFAAGADQEEGGGGVGIDDDDGGGGGGANAGGGGPIRSGMTPLSVLIDIEEASSSPNSPARSLTPEQRKALLKKAIKWRNKTIKSHIGQGGSSTAVVAVDEPFELGGPASPAANLTVVKKKSPAAIGPVQLEPAGPPARVLLPPISQSTGAQKGAKVVSASHSATNQAHTNNALSNDGLAESDSHSPGHSGLRINSPVGTGAGAGAGSPVTNAKNVTNAHARGAIQLKLEEAKQRSAHLAHGGGSGAAEEESASLSPVVPVASTPSRSAQDQQDQGAMRSRSPPLLSGNAARNSPSRSVVQQRLDQAKRRSLTFRRGDSTKPAGGSNDSVDASASSAMSQSERFRGTNPMATSPTSPASRPAPESASAPAPVLSDTARARAFFNNCSRSNSPVRPSAGGRGAAAGGRDDGGGGGGGGGGNA